VPVELKFRAVPCPPHPIRVMMMSDSESGIEPFASCGRMGASIQLSAPLRFRLRGKKIDEVIQLTTVFSKAAFQRYLSRAFQQ
jgi:hypothetical protein